MLKIKYMTLEEVTQYLRINIYTAYRMVEKGELPGMKIGRLWRFTQDDIDRYMRSQLKPKRSNYGNRNQK